MDRVALPALYSKGVILVEERGHRPPPSTTTHFWLGARESVTFLRSLYVAGYPEDCITSLRSLCVAGNPEESITFLRSLVLASSRPPLFSAGLAQCLYYRC